MEVGHSTLTFLLGLAILILALSQDDVIEINLPNFGKKEGAARLPLYQHIMDLNGRKHIRFSVKSGHANILLSEKHVSTMNYNIDYDYVEIIMWDYTKSLFRIGNLGGGGIGGTVNTPDLINPTEFRYFWVQWTNGTIQVGQGFEIGHEIFMKKNYPSTINIYYLSLWNGYGSAGDWRIFTGNNSKFPIFSPGDARYACYRYPIYLFGILHSVSKETHHGKYRWRSIYQGIMVTF